MIRKAQEKDFESILDLSEIFWKETQFSESFSREHTINMVQMAYDHELLAVVDIGKIVGFSAGVKSFLLGSDKAITGTELAWWVMPEHRGGRKGIQLLLFMEKLAKDADVKYWNMAYMISSMPEKIKSIYEKMGYKVSECVYTKKLRD